jgi:hypothetical protein
MEREGRKEDEGGGRHVSMCKKNFFLTDNPLEGWVLVPRMVRAKCF